MFGHAGGAADLGAPSWLLAYGAAACVVLVTVAFRARTVGPLTAPELDASDAAALGRGGWHGPTARWRAIGRVLGPALLAVTVLAAFVGPDSGVVNFAPAVVLVVWWIGLPLACVAVGDVMAWLEPFGLAAGRRRHHDDGDGEGPRWTAPLLLALATWWVHAYQDAASPRVLGAALLAYAVVATGGGWRWGRAWLRHGEAFGALSSELAGLRRAWSGSRTESPNCSTIGSVSPPVGLVSVWLGSVVFDVFAGSRAWVEVAGTLSGWARTAIATAVLAAAVAVAWVLVAGTALLVRRALDDSPGEGAIVGWAATGALLACTAGTFLAHGITLLLVDGQRALAHASDPFGRGWDLVGTRDLLTDYSPLTSGVVGTAQLVLVVGAHATGVAAAATRLRAAVRTGELTATAARRMLWMLGLVVAILVTASVAVLTTELE